MVKILILLSLIGCQTQEKLVDAYPDVQQQIDSIKLQVSTLSIVQDDLRDTVDGLRGVCQFNREHLQQLERALFPKKPAKKKKR